MGRCSLDEGDKESFRRCLTGWLHARQSAVHASLDCRSRRERGEGKTKRQARNEPKTLRRASNSNGTLRVSTSFSRPCWRERPESDEAQRLRVDRLPRAAPADSPQRRDSCRSIANLISHISARIKTTVDSIVSRSSLSAPWLIQPLLSRLLRPQNGSLN